MLRVYVLAAAWLASPKTSVASTTLAAAAVASPASPSLLQALSVYPAFAGAVGGVISAVLYLAVLFAAPEPPPARTVWRAVFDAIVAVVMGAIAGEYLTGVVQDALPWLHKADKVTVALAVGVVAWRVTPPAVEGLVEVSRRVIASRKDDKGEAK